MSQVKISGNASGTGVLTIAAPNTNTDRSITIPDKAGAIAVGAGTIVQVVQGTTTTNVLVTTTTWTDTTLTASITPTSSSNKILIMVNQVTNPYRVTTNSAAGIRILRDSTVVHTPADVGSGPYDQYVGAGGITVQESIMRYTICHLDSPSSTSSITYKTQGRPQTSSNSGRVSFQTTGGGTSSITLMEVVA